MVFPGCLTGPTKGGMAESGGLALGGFLWGLSELTHRMRNRIMPIPTHIQIDDRWWYRGFLDGLALGFVLGAAAAAYVLNKI